MDKCLQGLEIEKRVRNRAALGATAEWELIVFKMANLMRWNNGLPGVHKSDAIITLALLTNWFSLLFPFTKRWLRRGAPHFSAGALDQAQHRKAVNSAVSGRWFLTLKCIWKGIFGISQVWQEVTLLPLLSHFLGLCCSFVKFCGDDVPPGAAAMFWQPAHKRDARHKSFQWKGLPSPVNLVLFGKQDKQCYL